MNDIIGDHTILNDEILSVEYLLNEKLMTPDDSIYEVIRIIDEVPLFLEDHYKRLINSLNMMNIIGIISMNELRKKIKDLIFVNKMKNCNIKLIVNHLDNALNYLVYVCKSCYPNEKEILEGIKVDLIYLERNNPNSKVLNIEYKDKVAKHIKDNWVFEVLLVNDKNKITEGSRSNVFFVKDKKIITAPGEFILKGVTRKHVLKACEESGIDIIEMPLGAEELSGMDAAFLSGTSIKVLPISKIGDVYYRSSYNETVGAVGKRYDKIINQYILKNKRIS
jgi:branched-chain amino acid aminotransferase